MKGKPSNALASKQPNRNGAARHIAAWPSLRIDSVGDVQGGRQRSEKIVNGNPCKYLRVANVFDGYIDYSDVYEMLFTDREKDTYSLRPGDILLNEGQSLELVGRSAIYDGPPGTYCFQNTLIRFRPSSQITSEFAQQVFQFCLTTGIFASIAARTTSIAHLGVERFASLRIPVPPLPEQIAIAAVLSAWDRAIGQTATLIAARERLKQGLMQQLLSGRRRFRGLADGQWHEHFLGDLFDERVERGYVDLPLLSITADRGVIPRSEIDRKDNSNKDKSLYKRIMPGDIGYNTMRMWQGVSAASSLMGIVSPAYTVCIPKSQIHSDFAAYMFKHLPIVHIFHRYSQGLVNDTLNLKFPSFANIQLRIPGKHEQKKIVETFGCIDEDIRLLNKTLDRTKRQKRGLMQQLLTGKVRVPESLLKNEAKP